jgi:TRAP-type uncharacterized transport system fused permease subunit
MCTGTIGVIALAAGLEGQLLRPARWIERLLFIAAAFMLIDPGLVTDVIGLVVLAFGLVLQKVRRATVLPAVEPAPLAGRPGAPAA